MVDSSWFMAGKLMRGSSWFELEITLQFAATMKYEPSTMNYNMDVFSV